MEKLEKAKRLARDTWFEFTTNYKTSLFFAVGILIIIVCLLIVSKLTQGNVTNNGYVSRLKRLVTQASQWNVQARQSTHPVIRLAYCNYAVASAKAAEAMSTHDNIEKICKVKMSEFLIVLQNEQDEAFKHLSQYCPSVPFDGVYAATTGWMI